MPVQSQSVELTKKQRILLKDVVSGRTERNDHIIRAHIILLVDEGVSDQEIAKNLHIHKRTAGKWRRRWIGNQEKLLLWDEEETGIHYKRCVLSLLSDAERPGSPCKFTPEQICKIVNVACEKPEDIGLPLSHWSLSSLATECVKRHIIDSISTSQLAVFLNQADIKPHQVKEWIHTPIEDEEAFSATVKELSELYTSSPALHDEGTHVISCDEKTGIQALERDITPMKAGQCERQDSEYERHGTQC